MVFTVYGICTARGLYVLQSVEPEVYIQHQGGTTPCTSCKKHETADLYRRPYKANRQISFGARMLILYCALAVQHNVPYARRCSYSSIA